MLNRSIETSPSSEEGSSRQPRRPIQQNQLLNSLSLNNSILQQPMQMNPLGVLPVGLIMGPTINQPNVNPFLLGGSSVALDVATRTYLAHLGEIERQQILNRIIETGVQSITEEQMIREMSRMSDMAFPAATSGVQSFPGTRILTGAANNDNGLDYLISGMNSKRESNHKDFNIESSKPDVSASSNFATLAVQANNEINDAIINERIQRNSKKDMFLRRQDRESESMKGSYSSSQSRDELQYEKAPPRKRPKLGSIRFPSYKHSWNEAKQRIEKEFPTMSDALRKKILHENFSEMITSGESIILKEGFGWTQNQEISGPKEQS